MKLSDEVAAGLADGRPIVALESCALTHGLPAPHAILQQGAVATPGRHRPQARWAQCSRDTSSSMSCVDVGATTFDEPALELTGDPR